MFKSLHACALAPMVASAALTVVALTPGTATAAPVANIAELRAAIDEVNAGGASEVELAAGTTYTITGVQCDGLIDEDQNSHGDLDIDSDQQVRLFTVGARATIHNDCDGQRLIHMLGTGELVLENVRLTGGQPAEGNFGSASGGAVLAAGAVTLDQVVMSGNRAGDGIDGVEIDRDGVDAGFGGALWAEGAVVVEDSRFSGNSAGDGGAGYGTACVDGEGSGIPGGNGGDGGSGGAIGSRASVTVLRSTFVGNSAGAGGAGGGGACGPFDAVGAAGGSGGVGGSGGAIVCWSCAGQSTIEQTTISGNLAGPGGAGGAGGAGDGPAAGGSGGDGGAGGTGGAMLAFTDEPTFHLQVENATVQGNAAASGGVGGNGGGGNPPGSDGAAGSNGTAGALHVVALGGDATELTLLHASLVGNAGVSDGHSIFADEWTSIGSVVAEPTGNGCAGSPATAPAYSSGTDASCGLGAPVPWSTLALGPLRDNGGPTQTVKPTTGSPLLAAIPSGECSVAEDQRGLARTGRPCDIGAVQAQVKLTPKLVTAANGTASVKFVASWRRPTGYPKSYVCAKAGSTPDQTAPCVLATTTTGTSHTFNGAKATHYSVSLFGRAASFGPFVDWARLFGSSMAGSGGGTVAPGAQRQLATTLQRTGGPVLAGATVTLWRKPAGSSSWTKVGSRVTNDSGVAQATVTVNKTTTYQWRYAGGGAQMPGLSSGIVVKVS